LISETFLRRIARRQRESLSQISTRSGNRSRLWLVRGREF
jgi:hypothetical protein